jgi:predicted enzyme related to lactoylglutathione lyase
VADFDSLPHGTFCWPELSTTDQKGGTAFYRTLFGWDVNEQPIGPTETYTIFQMRGRDVAAAASMRNEERQHGVPSHWSSYISVQSADQAARRAGQLGGKVLMPPFDVMDAGRMAVVQDPTGAVFHVWQPNKHVGARIQREPGALCWTELATRDTNAAEKFYTEMFGWSSKLGGAGTPAEYTEFSVGGTPQAGMLRMTPEWGPDVPPHWMPYFQVSDCDATAARAREMGGRANVPPTDVPNVGRFAMLVDPQGAMFSVIKMNRA